MDVSKTYLFSDPANYTFDPTKIEFIDGKASLKLEILPGISLHEDFADDTGFVYNADEAEFVDGKVQQKNQVPANATFGASYDTDINGNWGAGNLTGTAYGGAAVSGGKLDLAHDDLRYVEYSAVGNADSLQQGCIRFKVTPNFSGGPATEAKFFSILTGNGVRANCIYLRMRSYGDIRCQIHDSAGNLIVETASFPTFVADTTYELELNFDLTAGASRLFIDGVQVGNIHIGTGTRDAATILRVGTGINGTSSSYFAIEDFIVFDTVQHTANYTPGYSVFNNEYVTTTVILPWMTSPGPGYIMGLLSVASVESGTPRYTIALDAGYLYYDGAAWVASDGTYAQANDITTFSANIPTVALVPSAGGYCKIHFTDSSSQSSVSDMTVSCLVQRYQTNHPNIVPLESLRTDAFKAIVASTTIVNSDTIQYALQVDGVAKYWDGSAWSESTGHTQSNTLAEINANVASLLSLGAVIIPVIYLHSHDGKTDPIIDELTITGDYSAPLPTTPTIIPVYGYVYSPDGSPLSGVTVKAFLNSGAAYSSQVDISTQRKSTTTNSIGYWELDLIETDSMPSGSKYYVMLEGSDYHKIYLVSVPLGASFYNIQSLV